MNNLYSIGKMILTAILAIEVVYIFADLIRRKRKAKKEPEIPDFDDKTKGNTVDNMEDEEWDIK